MDSDGKPDQAGQAPAASGAQRVRKLGGYELVSRIGQGATGTVYKARQVSTGRTVALKVLLPHVAKDARFVERFQRDAAASIKLNHPNLVQGLEVGHDQPTGLRYFVMEFVDGPSLRQVLAQRGALPEEEALKIAVAVGRALETARQAGLVHRNLKPANILLAPNGEPKLADLGLARQIDEAQTVGASGQVIGTPHYLAPEQVRGETALIDCRTDMYALGATLFHLVAGRTPFYGATAAAILAKHVAEPPPRANQVNPEVSADCALLISRLLQKERARRIQTPGEFVAEAEKLFGRRGVLAANRSRPAHSRPSDTRVLPAPEAASGKPAGVPRKRIVAVAAAALTALVVIAAGLLGWRLMHGAKDAAQAPWTPGPWKQDLTSPAPVAPVAVGRSEVDRMFQEAQDWEKNNPTAFDDAVLRYRKTIEAARGSQLEAAISDRVYTAIAASEERKAKALEEAWKPIEQDARQKAGAGDYDGALLAAVAPPAFAAKLHERALLLANELRTEAEAKIGAALAKAGQAAGQGRTDDALKALAEAEKIQYAPLAEQFATLKAKLTAEANHAAETKKQQELAAAQAKLGEYLARFEQALLEKDDLAEARRAAQEAVADAGVALLKNQAAAMGPLADAYAEVLRARTAALSKLIGKPFALGWEKGLVKQVDGGQLVVEVKREGSSGGLTFIKKVKWSELTEEQRKQLPAEDTPATAAGKVAAALCKLRRGQEDALGAQALLEQAPEFPLTPRYLESSKILLLGATEVAAERAWPELEAASQQPCNTPDQGKALLKALEDFERAHGGTKFARSKAQERTALRSRAEKAAAVNKLLNGDFETGDLAPWQKGGGMATVIKTIAGKDGRETKVLIISGGGVATFSNEAQVAEGTDCEFSFWTRCESAGKYSLDWELQPKPGGSLVRGSAAGRVGPGNWEEHNTSFRSEAPQYQVRIALRTQRDVFVTVCLDDVRLLPKAAAPETAASSPVPADALHFGGHAYKVFTGPLAWQEAKLACERLSGRLAVINTREEDDFVREQARAASRDVWIGYADLTGNGRWTWVTGESVPYVAAAKKVFDMAPGTPRAARYAAFNQYRWDDCAVTTRVAYCCEWDALPEAGTPKAATPK